MKIFISQPMANKTDEEIINERNEIIQRLKNTYGENIEIIDSLFTDQSDKYINPAVYYLGKSIQCLASADLAYFAKGWNSARGCKIEYIVASEYNINKIIEY